MARGYPHTEAQKIKLHAARVKHTTLDLPDCRCYVHNTNPGGRPTIRDEAYRQEYHRTYYRNYQRAKAERLRAYKEARGCADCSETDPIVLEFDHVRGEKNFTIGEALRSKGWDDILAEIEKCDVVCANCHRRRTALRRELTGV